MRSTRRGAAATTGTRTNHKTNHRISRATLLYALIVSLSLVAVAQYFSAYRIAAPFASVVESALGDFRSQYYSASEEKTRERRQLQDGRSKLKRTLGRGGLDRSKDTKDPTKVSTSVDLHLVSNRATDGDEEKNESVDHTENKQKKNYLVFHIGLPKTGTTSLQVDFTRMNATLNADNYFYAGRYYYPKYIAKKHKIAPNRSEHPLVNMAKDMFSQRNCKTDQRLVDCVQDFKQALEPYKGRNVFLSDEGYNVHFSKPEHYQAMRDALGDEWDIRITVGYRRFFQWLPSDMFQRYRMDKLKGERNWKNHWPGVEGSPGEKVTLLFPSYYKIWADLGHRFVDFAVDNVRDTLPLQVLNLHDKDHATASIQTNFLCHVLPDAPKSCAESQRLERLHELSTLNDAKGALHVNYDMLTTGAAELGLIDLGRFQRRAVREALRTLAETELGKSPWDFELRCPEQDQLDEFLNMSLELEEKSLGKDMAARMEADSRAAFQQLVESHKFCEVDAAATLVKEPWKSFFAQYAPQSAS